MKLEELEAIPDSLWEVEVGVDMEVFFPSPTSSKSDFLSTAKKVW